MFDADPGLCYKMIKLAVLPNRILHCFRIETGGGRQRAKRISTLRLCIRRLGKVGLCITFDDLIESLFIIEFFFCVHSQANWLFTILESDINDLLLA